MTRILVLGGYGGFGARLSRRLAEDGCEVLVAGRSARKAARFAATLSGAIGIRADRKGDLAALLAEHRPRALIDAAGPFQGSDYRVPRACIAAGVHYLDLADGRDFVTGIDALDAEARAAGVAIVAGASSVPALSGAVIRSLSKDMREVRAIRISISASNRATAGNSVASAILSYVGQPVRLWIGGRWQVRTGLQMVKRERYAIGEERPLRRLVALADVPDHQIWPETLPGKPATIFRAGPELAFQLRALWLLSWPVRWGLWRSARWTLPLLMPFRRLTAWAGSDVSAMQVEVDGRESDQYRNRSWTLIARDGLGPEIPTMAAQLLVRSLDAGRLKPGARHAGGALELAAFEPLLKAIGARSEARSRSLRPLYARVMGPRFDTLPRPVRAMHGVVGDGGGAGSATVVRGKGLFAGLVARIMRFPPAGEHALHVSFAERNGVERWTRDFGGHVFSSELRQSGRFVVERFGPMRFAFDLDGGADGLEMVMRKWSIFRIRLPLALAPRSRAREWAEGEWFRFDVPVELPLIGLVVHYSGRLKVVG